MKSSFTDTTAAALRGFAGWFSGRAAGAMPEVDHVPFVVSACGYRGQEGQSVAEAAQSGEGRARWHPGLSLDNFS